MVAVRGSDDSDGSYVDGPELEWEPAAQRSEVEVAADALMALFEAGILSIKDATLIARVARHTGLAPAELRSAHERHLTGRVVKPRSTMAMPTAQDFNTYRKRDRQVVKRHTSTPFTPRQAHEPAIKYCGRCQRDLPIEEFLASWRQSKADRTVRLMKRAAYCHDCRKDYQKQRYLTIDKQRVLELVLAGDEGVVGQQCPECRQPFEAGDSVTGHLTQLRHLEGTCSSLAVG